MDTLEVENVQITLLQNLWAWMWMFRLLSPISIFPCSLEGHECGREKAKMASSQCESLFSSLCSSLRSKTVSLTTKSNWKDDSSLYVSTTSRLWRAILSLCSFCGFALSYIKQVQVSGSSLFAFALIHSCFSNQVCAVIEKQMENDTHNLITFPVSLKKQRNFVLIKPIIIFQNIYSR